MFPLLGLLVIMIDAPAFIFYASLRLESLSIGARRDLWLVWSNSHSAECGLAERAKIIR